MMNSTKIKLPSFGLPLAHKGQNGRFPNAVHDRARTPITVRERTMLALMDVISEKPDWDRKVSDDGIAQKWREATQDGDLNVSKKVREWVSGYELCNP